MGYLSATDNAKQFDSHFLFGKCQHIKTLIRFYTLSSYYFIWLYSKPGSVSILFFSIVALLLCRSTAHTVTNVNGCSGIMRGIIRGIITICGPHILHQIERHQRIWDFSIGVALSHRKNLSEVCHFVSIGGILNEYYLHPLQPKHGVSRLCPPNCPRGGEGGTQTTSTELTPRQPTVETGG